MTRYYICPHCGNIQGRESALDKVHVDMPCAFCDKNDMEPQSLGFTVLYDTIMTIKAKDKK